MSGKNILVVEDEEDIQTLIEYHLKRSEYHVTLASTGDEALKHLRANVPDLVLLDLMIPGPGGLEICKLMRQDPRTANVPIIIVTAHGDESDVVLGLGIGADDYVSKPFSPKVLLARIKATLRRTSSAQGAVETAEPAAATPEAQSITAGPIRITPSRHEVTVNGQLVQLTLTEYRILQMLAQRPGWVFNRRQIVGSVMGQDMNVTQRTIDVHVASLRKKLGEVGDMIQTVRGVGYRIKDH